MPTYKCPHCGKMPDVRSNAIGKSVACPYCHKPFFVPAPEEPWFISNNNRVLGPFTTLQLKQFAVTHELKPDDAVCQGELGNWVPANMVKGLFPSPPPPVSVPPPESLPQISPSEVVSNRSDHRSRRRTLIIVTSAAFGVAMILGLCVALVALFLSRHGANIAAPSSPSPLTTEQVVSRAEQSVALIEGRLSHGTGFVLRRGIIVTNKHVIEGELIDHLQVHFPSAANRGPFAAELLYKDPDRDLAFLSIDASLPPLTLAREHAFRRGEDVTVIGNPGVGADITLQNAVSRGVMSSQATIKGQEYYQLGISVNPGNSGGPVLDSAGNVIGVVTLKASENEGMGFCVPLHQLTTATARLDDLSQSDIATARSRHRLQVVFTRVGATASLYSAGMQIYIDSMQDAIKEGNSVDDGLVAARGRIESRLVAFDSTLVKELEQAAAKISADPSLEEGTRQRFVDFWTNYLELKGYVENPRGNLITYREKCLELTDKHMRYSKALELLLGNE